MGHLWGAARRSFTPDVDIHNFSIRTFGKRLSLLSDEQLMLVVAWLKED